MSEPRSVIVIGAGIIGCAIARELGRRGAHVTLIDSRAIGAGATQASAGVLAPYIEAHERGPLLDLAVHSLSLYDRFAADVEADSGLSIEFRRPGTLEIAADDAAAGRLRATAAAHAEAGVDVEWLDAREAATREPALPPSIAGALLVRSHGYVRVQQLIEALAWAAMRHGVEVETSHRVTAVRPGERTLDVLGEDGSRWTADAVVVAAGSWSGELELPDEAVRGVRPVRGQLIRLGWRGRPLTHVLWGPDCYVVPWTDGTALVGATVEDVGFDERTTAAGVRDLLDAVCELVPEAWGATFVEARAGLRPATASGLPLIGASPSVPGLFYATGHYRNGILLAPLTAMLIADLVLDGQQHPLLAAVAPGA